MPRMFQTEVVMQRKEKGLAWSCRAACAVATLIASLGAGAFTFSDGKTASCMAAGKTVEETEVDPAVAGNGFTGKTISTSSGFQILWDAARLKALPPDVHDYIFFHECAHARVPTVDEIQANCVGLRDMRAAGRAGAAVEARLGAFYGPGSAYWARTLECASTGASPPTSP
jgi:hypothetical protein